MSALFGGFYFFLIYIYWIVPLAPIVYIFIKWRSYQDNAIQDPQLGLKSILFYFKTLAFHACLASLSTFFYGIIEKKEDFTNIGIGILISGIIIYTIQAILINKRTNYKTFPATERVYLGLNMVITGLVAMISFTFTVTNLINNGLTNIQVPFIIFIIYTFAMVFQTRQFSKPTAKTV